MKITPSQIEHSGPGIDLSSLPEGVSIKMSDPVKDFKYARNAVTLTFDLSEYENVRLSFKEMEFGEEPHAPPPNPFTGEADFDGVAVSADGVTWYEIQDLRYLRSDRFLGYDIDLDATIAQWGLSFGSEFQIRFCQYDNNPAPMDGIFLQIQQFWTPPQASVIRHSSIRAATPTLTPIPFLGRTGPQLWPLTVWTTG